MTNSPSANLLDTYELGVIVGRWQAEDRDAILGIPEVAGLIGRIDHTWARYLKVEPAVARRTRVAELAGLQKRYDLSHDELLRAFWFLFTARACYLRGQLPPQTEAADAVEALRDRLLPAGLAGTQQTYLKEEANAQQTLRAIQPADEPLLNGMVFEPGVTALQVLRQLAERATQLGDTDRAKSAVTAQADEQENLITLRHDLVKLVMLVVELARLAEGPQPLVARVVGQYHQALARLAQTMTQPKRSDTATPPTPPAGPVPVTPPPAEPED